MNIPKMVIIICLLYKMLFTFWACNLFMSPFYMHVALSYTLKISIIIFTLHLTVLVTGVWGHWIHGYLYFSLNLHVSDHGVLESHVIPEQVIILQVLLTLFTFPVLDIKMLMRGPFEHRSKS